MAGTLDIRAFGGLIITVAGQPVGSPLSRKAEALLFYLAYTRRPQARDLLAELFWPERDQETAGSNLRAALSHLRRDFAPYVLITRETVAVNPAGPYRLDVQELEACVERTRRAWDNGYVLDPGAPGEQAAALDLYRGDLLEGIYLRDSPGFEQWVTVERERLRNLVIEFLAQTAERSIAIDDYHSAQAYTVRLLRIDPPNEDAHRRMMSVLALTGQRSLALAQYERCRQILREELGVEPEPDTVALYERIRTAGRTTARMPVSRPPAPAPRPNNLPAQSTPLIGRDAELAQIARLLADPACRLLTLVGPGGTGKTRLAIEAAGAHLADFKGGVFFLPLSGLNSANLLLSTFVETLAAARLLRSGHPDPWQWLLACLGQEPVLLVVDNFEHLAGGADFLAEILARGPQVKLLVTSRQRLKLSDEWAFDLDGLRFPRGADFVGLAVDEAARKFPALALFRLCARRKRAAFDLAADELHDAARICALVEGSPLGIELAASWLRTLSCAEIATELAADAGFLSAPPGDLPDRHSSLQTVFDYSWRMLSDDERAAFAGLAVFRSGFTRQAAAPVAGASLPLLGSLIDKSFVRRDAAGRYHVHELMRQFGEARGNEGAVDLDAARDRHCVYFCRFVADRHARIRGPEQAQALAEIVGEIDNVRAAWDWAIARGRWQDLEPTLDSLYDFYTRFGWGAEARSAFERAARGLQQGPRPEDHQGLLGKLLARQAIYPVLFARDWVNPRDTLSLLDRGLDLARAAGDQAETAFVLDQIARFEMRDGRLLAACERLKESIAIYRRIGDRWGEAVALSWLGIVLLAHGDFAAALEQSEASLVLKREVGDRRGVSYELTHLGSIMYGLGRYELARRRYREALAVLAELGEEPRQMRINVVLAGIAELTGEHEDAAQLLEEVVAEARQHVDVWQVAPAVTQQAFARLARVRAGRGVHESARELLDEVWTHAGDQLNPLGQADVLVITGEACLLAGEHAEARRNFEAAWSLMCETENRPVQAEILSGRALIACAEGSYAQARELAGKALALSRAMGSPYREALALRALGLAALGAGEPAEARGCLGCAWQIARQIGAAPLALDLLVDEAEMLAPDGCNDQVRTLLAAPLHDGRATVLCRDRARGLLDHLPAAPSPGDACLEDLPLDACLPGIDREG